MFCQNSVLLTIVCCFVVISSAVLIDDLSDNQNETAGLFDVGAFSEQYCPQGYDLTFDTFSGKYECRCKKYHLFWPQDGLCYRENDRGPCPEGHRLVRKFTQFSNEEGVAVCECPMFSTKFNEDGVCYQEFTKGPCPEGQIIIHDRKSQNGVCKCDQSLTMYFYPETRGCYELYTRGPCPQGHVLAFDYAEFRPVCRCQDDYTLHKDGNCYQLNTQGPCTQEMQESCPNGTACFMKSVQALDVGCTCLPSNSVTKEGRCYQPYTRGPCEFGEWLVHDPDTGELGDCTEKPHCKRFDNWHWWPKHERCYRQFSQGPCKRGQLFYLNPEAGGQPSCDCKEEWAAYHWRKTGECFEQDSVGPCASGQYFGFSHETGEASCSCFKNFVPMEAPASNRRIGIAPAVANQTIAATPAVGCVELYTADHCPRGKIATKDVVSGAMKCDCHSGLSAHYWPQDGNCYELYTRGPCAEDERFRPHPLSFRPICVKWALTSRIGGY